MRTLSLLRHAKSSWANLSLKDHDRPLNGRGKKAAPAMANFMRDKQVDPTLILCSTAKRTRQTLDLIIDAFDNDPEVVFDESLYLASPRDILDLVKSEAGDNKHIMVIGHNPGLHTLALLMLDNGDPKDIAAMSGKFPTAALATLDFSIKSWDEISPNSGHLRFYMTPKLLAS